MLLSRLTSSAEPGRYWPIIPAMVLAMALADPAGPAAPAAAGSARVAYNGGLEGSPASATSPLLLGGIAFATTRGPIAVTASGAAGRAADALIRFGHLSDVHDAQIIHANPARGAIELPARPGTDVTAQLESLGPGSYALPAGAFFGRDIDLKSGVRLYGQGAAHTEIKLPEGSINSHEGQEHVYLLDLTDTSDVHLFGLRLDGNKNGQVLHNTRSSPFPGWYVGRENGGWHVIQANGATDLVLAGIAALNAGTDGLNIGKGARNIKVLASTFDGNRRQGVSVKDVDGLEFRDVTFSNTGGQKPEAGVDLEANHAGDVIRDVSFHHTRFFGNNGAGLMVDSRGAALNGLLIENSRFSGRRGVEVKGRRHDGHTAVFENVIIARNDVEGDLILGGAGKGGGVHENTTLRDNRIGGRVLVQKAGAGSSFKIEGNYTPSNDEVSVVYRD